MTGVAIVIPCFNLARLLPEALESVAAQSHPAAEVVVVDDGSDDALTRQVLSAARRRGTCVLTTVNRGVAAARNLGVRHTSAPLVVLLDADDVLVPTCLERLAAVLDGRPDLDFLTCGLEAFGQAGYTWLPPPCSWAETLARGGPHISTMFRRRVWEDVGGFDETLPAYEDMDFWLSAIERGFRGEVLPETLLRYRVRAGSRYQSAIRGGRYLETMAAIHAKHPPPSPGAALDLLLAKNDFLAGLRQHRQALAERRSAAEATLEPVRHEIIRVRSALAAAQVSEFDWGDLRRTDPVSPVWGVDRGTPVDRYYIERFIEQHRHDIKGAVLEVKEPVYAGRFGGAGVSAIDVVDVDGSNEKATRILDLERPDPATERQYDCFILTQTLQFIYGTEAALTSAWTLLKPGGVLLCTVPAMSRVSYEDLGVDGDFWRFTEAALRGLALRVFPPDGFEVSSYGNITACAAFLHGLAVEEISSSLLDHRDPSFPLVCCLRAVKPKAAEAAGAGPRVAVVPPADTREALILLYHRISVLDPDTHGLCVAPAAFEEQMQHLRASWHPMRLEDLLANAIAGSLRPGSVAVTFDDGYLDNLTNASPVLESLEIPATFFVNTQGWTGETERWWDLLERIFLEGQPLPPLLDLLGDGGWLAPTTDMQARTTAHRRLFELMYPMSAADRVSTLDRVLHWSRLSLAPRATHRPMTRDEVAVLASRPGHDVGVHGVAHLALPHHTRSDQLHEVLQCKLDLERLLQRRVTSLAYPYGAFNRQVLDTADSAGFTYGLSVEGRSVHVGAARLLIPRLEVRGTDGAGFASLLQRTAGRAAARDRH